MGERMRLFMIYSAGNFIECTTDTPYLQIGEHKYGKPVLDRAINYEMDIYDALKVGLVSIELDHAFQLSASACRSTSWWCGATPAIRNWSIGSSRASPISPTCASAGRRRLRAAHIGIPRPPYTNKR